MEKMIKISPNDWHYKLIKYTFNIEGKELSNLCPYFWLLVASLFSCPFVFLYKIFIHPILDYSNLVSASLLDKMYYESLKNIKEENIEMLVYAIKCTPIWYDDIKFSKILPDKVISRSRMDGCEQVYKDWCKVNDKEEQDIDGKYTNNSFFEKAGSLNLFRENYKIYNKKNIDKAKATKISSNTKNIAKVLFNLMLLCLMWAVFFGLSLVIISILSTFVVAISNEPNVSLVITCIIMVAILSAIFREYLFYSTISVGDDLVHLRLPKEISIIEAILFFVPSLVYIVLYYLIYKAILLPFFTGVWIVLTETFDIFGVYLKSAYSDYCPGIEWDDEEKEQKEF